MDQFEKYFQFQKEVAQATIKIVECFQEPGGEWPQKRSSSIDIVLNVPPSGTGMEFFAGSPHVSAMEFSKA